MRGREPVSRPGSPAAGAPSRHARTPGAPEPRDPEAVAHRLTPRGRCGETSVDPDSIGTKNPFLRAGKEPIDHAVIRARRATDQPVLATVEALDFELLPRLDAILPAKLGQQHDLTS